MLEPAPGSAAERAEATRTPLRRDERLLLRRLGAAVLSARHEVGRPPAALRRATAGVRAEQHVLPAAQARPDRGLAGGDAGRLPVRREGPARRQHGGPRRRPGRHARLAPAAVSRLRERLGWVLFRVPANVRRDDDRLAALLGGVAGRPPAHPRGPGSRRGRSTRSSTVSPGSGRRGARPTSTMATSPTIRLLAPWLYLRLRRTSYDGRRPRRLGRPARAVPRRGHDAYVFFRHDATGESACLGASRSPSGSGSAVG